MENKRSEKTNNRMEFGMRIARNSILEEIKKGGKENLVVSPLSLHIALNMLASGCTGRTLEQLLGFLESDGITHLNAQSSLLMELATGDSDDHDDNSSRDDSIPQNPISSRHESSTNSPSYENLLYRNPSSETGPNPYYQNQFAQNPSTFPLDQDVFSHNPSPFYQNQFLQSPNSGGPYRLYQNPSIDSGTYQNQFTDQNQTIVGPYSDSGPYRIYPNQFPQNQSSDGSYSYNGPYRTYENPFIPHQNPSSYRSYNRTYENQFITHQNPSSYGPYRTYHENQFDQNPSKYAPYSFYPNPSINRRPYRTYENQFSQGPSRKSRYSLPADSSYETPSKCNGPTICLVNGIWVDKRSPMKHSFKQLMEDVYNANAVSVDFLTQAEKVTEEINTWAREASKGHIDPLFVVLANALYFKGTWVDTFNAEYTRDQDFHLLNGKTVRVPFMRTWRTYKSYGSFDGFKILKMGYKSGRLDNKSYAMYIYLPDKNDGLQELVEKFNSDPRFFTDNLKLQCVELYELSVPKLKYEFELDAKESMKKLGLDLPFDDERAEIKEIVETSRLIFVSEAIQKAYIEVNEEGTVATAVTALTMCFGSAMPVMEPPKINFIADHPFLFMIKEEVSDTVLFVGAALNPLA